MKYMHKAIWQCDGDLVIRGNTRALLFDGCTGVSGFTNPYANMGACVAATGYPSLSESTRMCRSYHLCNALSSAANKMTHCPHAVGVGLCP